MASKSEQREQLRREREAAQRKAASGGKARLYLGYAAAGGLSLAVLAGLVIVLFFSDDQATDANGNSIDAPELAFISQNSGFDHGYEGDGREGTPPPGLEQGDLETAAEEAGCELDLDLRDEGNTHLRPDQDPPDYGTVPANSGDHNPEQQADGAYLDEIEPQYYVHAQEHGRVTIEYSPDLPEDQQLELKGVFEEDPNGVLLFPNGQLESGEVAMGAWTNIMKCPSYEGRATLDAVRDFRDTYRGAYNPESVPLAF